MEVVCLVHCCLPSMKDDAWYGGDAQKFVPAWMDGWIDGWLGGQMNAWMDVWMDGWKGVYFRIILFS